VSLRTLEFATGESPVLRSPVDDVWYVLGGEATLVLDGEEYEVAAGTGIYLAPDRSARIRNPHATPLQVSSARCPEPADPDRLECAERRGPQAHPMPLVRLSERPRATTGDRWYCVLVGEEMGCRQVTQFVGSIPPGRAPDHYHHYEEVIVILAGQGVAWAGRTSTPIATGSCIYLPREQVHCLENTGEEALVLLGVFYPAGSPAVRYDAGSSTTGNDSAT
jgi:mannose-6-phosphate isomerase-like protein (cupin superfamily)